MNQRLIILLMCRPIKENAENNLYSTNNHGNSMAESALHALELKIDLNYVKGIASGWLNMAA
jgi:hypothetical protein